MISLERWPKLKRLREKLNGKAKTEPEFRFFRLYDKVYRSDVLEAAYAQCRSNDGAPGVDGRTFDDIAAYGVERFLAELADELKTLRYEPEAVRRVLIPKAGQPGQLRPLALFGSTKKGDDQRPCGATVREAAFGSNLRSGFHRQRVCLSRRPL